MLYKSHNGKVAVAASQHTTERKYWLNKLSGELERTSLPYDIKIGKKPGYFLDRVNIKFPEKLSAKLLKLSNGSDIRLHMILVAGLISLVYKYTGSKDIMVGVPIYRQNLVGRLINTFLVLRSLLKPGMTFKELLLSVRVTIGIKNPQRI